MNEMDMMYKMKKDEAERFVQFLKTETDVPDWRVHYDYKDARTMISPNYTGRKKKMYDEYWVGKFYEDEIFVLAFIPETCYGNFEDIMTRYGKKYPDAEYLESIHIGTCDGSFNSFGHVVGTEFRWAFAVRADYYEEEKTPEIRETSENDKVIFSYTHDGDDDTKIVFYSDENGTHLECSHESEDPDCGTETILYNSSDRNESIKTMTSELLEEISGYLDATDNGNMRRGRDGLEQYYDDYNNSTLYAVEAALSKINEEKFVA